MAYPTVDGGSRRRGPTAEFWLYFAAILLVSLPIAAVQWLIGLGGDRPNPGILSRAVSKARIITPTIFSA